MTSIDLTVNGETTTLTTPEAMTRVVYRERAHLLALLAAVAMSDGRGEPMVHIGETDPETPGWTVLTFEFPTGQASWHIAPDDVELFRHVRPTTEEDRPWDGHSTDTKYERIRSLIGALLTTTPED